MSERTESTGAKITEEIPVTLAEAFRRLETAARKYVPGALDPKRTPAWNNHDGTLWPELRSALAAVEEAKRGSPAAARPEILDACCGGRMWWWDKAHPLAVYVDERTRPQGTIPQKPLWKIMPDVLADFRDLPFEDDSFQLVVFDPPHQVRSRAGTGINAEQYGSWEPGERDAALTLGFAECWRVLAPGGTLVFKWAGRVAEVEPTFPSEPIVGTRPRGRKEGPAWVIFYKPLGAAALEAAA